MSFTKEWAQSPNTSTLNKKILDKLIYLTNSTHIKRQNGDNTHSKLHNNNIVKSASQHIFLKISNFFAICQAFLHKIFKTTKL